MKALLAFLAVIMIGATLNVGLGILIDVRLGDHYEIWQSLAYDWGQIMFGGALFFVIREFR